MIIPLGLERRRKNELVAEVTEVDIDYSFLCNLCSLLKECHRDVDIND